MNEFQDFIEYIIDNIDDPRVSISKKLKYGFKYLYINLDIPNINSRSITIVIDNRNMVIELVYDYGESLVYESKELIDKYTPIIDSVYEKRLSDRTSSLIGQFMEDTDTTGKDFWREWTMNKIFKDKEDDSKL